MSKHKDDVKTRVVGLALGKLTRELVSAPDNWASGIRHVGGVTLSQASVGNVGTCRVDEKQEAQVGAGCDHECGCAEIINGVDEGTR